MAGCLGHGNKLSIEEPQLIQALQSHEIISAACGTNYSAAITKEGELYTWGLGNYGRLGHGTHEDKDKPSLVVGLKGI